MKKINKVNDIDTSTEHGRLLLAAVAKIMRESQQTKNPDQVMEQLNELADKNGF